MTDMSLPQEENPGDEASEYRRILLKEVSNHRLFARFTVITSLGLIGVGVAIADYFFAVLGYLLVVLGALRFLNSFYDLQREDKLQKELRRIEKTFESREALQNATI